MKATPIKISIKELCEPSQLKLKGKRSQKSGICMSCNTGIQQK